MNMNFKDLLIFRESAHVVGGRAEGRRISPLSTEPDAGLNPTTLRS